MACVHTHTGCMYIFMFVDMHVPNIASLTPIVKSFRNSCFYLGGLLKYAFTSAIYEFHMNCVLLRNISLDGNPLMAAAAAASAVLTSREV